MKITVAESSVRPRFLRTSRWALVLGIAPLLVMLAVGAGPPKKVWPRSVQKAFNSIETKECYDHVAVLASDAFEGRAAGEDGGRLASEYIAMRHIENGIAPGGPGGSYFQRFPLLLRKSRQGELAYSNFIRLFKPGAKLDPFDLQKDFAPAELSGEAATGGELFYLSAALAAAGELPPEIAGKVVLMTEETLIAEIALTPTPLTPPEPAPPEPVPPDPAAPDPAAPEPAPPISPEPDPDAPPPPPEPRPLDRLVNAGVRAVLVVTEDRNHPGFEPDSWPAGDATIAARLPIVRLGLKSSERLLRRAATKISKAEKADGVNFKEWRVFVSVSRMGHPYGLGRNVIGVLPGTDEKLAKEMVVIGAHFDHIGYARDPRLTKGKSGEIHNGADDNASGSSGLIELSESFATQPEVERARTLVFISFDAEELGLVGSHYYVAHCPFPIENTVAMLNMDMISRNGPQEMYYGKDDRFSGLNDLVEGVGAYFNIKLDTTGMDEYMQRSDQAAFLARGIPAVFLFGGDHPQYHTEKDDLELINPIKIQNISRFMFLCAYECANHPGSFKN